ncbi:CoA-transferase family III domain-containing protein [Crepidotus variabilis]|uniref:CoA-transferase family III domain-containing protein n=1 Tax=Crepidotus variabilis TaxID=179855 RepID=A0A9P6E7F4_9AGAR|nr:CoA-transferase family III domain-containing protein [Crepidotus variabilis]
MSTFHLPEELKQIWVSNGLPESFLARLKLEGASDTAVNSSFRIGDAAQVSIGLSGLSASYLYYLQTGEDQLVNVDARHAVLSFHSEAWYTINGSAPKTDSWGSIAGLYPTKDLGWVRIHTNFPHHRSGILSILAIPDPPDNPATRSAVEEAILQRKACDFEEECAEKGFCVSAFRSLDEWEKHPQSMSLQGCPPVQVIKIRDGQARSSSNRRRPLDGIKILDLSRVLAGPIAGRTLAAHGAEVLLVTSPSLPSLPALDVETSLGKRTVQLDLKDPLATDKLRELLKGADVFVQAYRPGGLEAKGIGVDDILTLKAGTERGVVCANLRAWGWDGPWKDRGGFDSLVQTATGFNADEGLAYQKLLHPNIRYSRPLPLQALDHTTAYFLTFGINVALCRRFMEGGSYEVRVSLASVGQWVPLLPRQAFELGKPLPKDRHDQEIKGLSVDWQRRRGLGSKDDMDGRRDVMRALRHDALLEKTPVREGIIDPEKGEIDWGAPFRLDADNYEAVDEYWKGEGLSG